MCEIPKIEITTEPLQIGYSCRICGNFIELNEEEKIALAMGHQISVFPMCDNCCAFIRKLKEREKNELDQR